MSGSPDCSVSSHPRPFVAVAHRNLLDRPLIGTTDRLAAWSDAPHRQRHIRTRGTVGVSGSGGELRQAGSAGSAGSAGKTRACLTRCQPTRPMTLHSPIASRAADRLGFTDGTTPWCRRATQTAQVAPGLLWSSAASTMNAQRSECLWGASLRSSTRKRPISQRTEADVRRDVLAASARRGNKRQFPAP